MLPFQKFVRKVRPLLFYTHVQYKWMVRYYFPCKETKLDVFIFFFDRIRDGNFVAKHLIIIARRRPTYYQKT